jgi:hypothetical protein
MRSTSRSSANAAGGPEVSSGSIPDADLIIVGYLSCPTGPDHAFLGAVLITDHRTRPLQFAYVAPVRPTTIQRILYGSTLSEHVKVDIIIKKLFSDGVSYEPHVLFVDSADLLAARRVVSVPVAHLFRPREPQNCAAGLSTLQYDTGGNGTDQELIGQVLARLEPSGVDLVAPFERVGEALTETLKDSSRTRRGREG